MAAFRKASAPVVEKRRAVMASAMRYNFGGAQTWRVIPEGDRRWQQEAWRFYDSIGELRYAVGWKGNACSQATLYAADVDPMTGRPTGPTENTRAQQIANGVLGGPVKRPQLTRTLILNLELVGEVYVVVVAATEQGKDDDWLVVSATEMKVQQGVVEFINPKTGMPLQLTDNDMMIRIFNPHARLQINADSAIRAQLPTLREIERASQNIAARLDSRLASAGILLLPDDIDFPYDDSDPEAPQGFTEMLTESMRRSLQEPGSAAAQVPITIEVPADSLANIQHLTFETEVSKEVVDLRKDGISRFAAGVDLPREVLEGMGTSNHWSAWQVQEDTYKTHLLPILDLLSDALTEAWYVLALEAARVPNPTDFMLAFDGSTLVADPDPLAEAMALYDHDLITGEAVLTMTSTPEEYAPTEEQRLQMLAQKLVLASPALFVEPELRRLLGFKEDAVAAPKTAQGIVAPAQPVAAVPAGTPADDGTGAPASDGQPPTAPSVTASADFRAASLAVTYALERAGNKILNTQRLKGEFAAIPRHEVHARMNIDPDRHGDLLDGAWRHTGDLAERFGLPAYTLALLTLGEPHTDANLTEWIDRKGLNG